MLLRSRTGTGLLATFVATLSLVVVTSPPSPAGAQTAPSFGFFIDAPFVQTAYYTLSDRSNVQEFNSLPLSTTAVSPDTWSRISASNGILGTWRVVAGDQWGGATTIIPSAFGDPQIVTDETTRSQYALIAQNNSLTIDLATPATCLGFWWSGGDPYNQVEFFTTDASGNRDSVARITTEALTERLKNADGTVANLKVAALGGTEYDAIDFYGHPVSSGAPATRRWGPPGTMASGAGTNLFPYLYVHAIAQGGVTFDRLVLSQEGPGNFEFDNLTLSNGCTVKQSLVLIAEVLDQSFAQRFIAAQTVTTTSGGASPTLSCTPPPLVVGSVVDCSVSGGDPDIDILWSASTGGDEFAGQGVRLDRSGQGTFSFVVPPEALGEPVFVELVRWLAPVPIGVAGGPIPVAVPSGEGPAVPVRMMVFSLLVAVGAAVAVRRQAGAD